MKKFIIRTITIIIGIVIAYIIVKKFIKPKILYPNCLVSTNSCVTINFWKYQNSFLSQVISSNLWVWFSGKLLYIYAQSTASCGNTTDGSSVANDYDPVTVIQISLKNGVINYQRLSDECVTSLKQIMQYYNINGEKMTLRYRLIGNPTFIDIFEKILSDGLINVNKI